MCRAKGHNTVSNPQPLDIELSTLPLATKECCQLPFSMVKNLAHFDSVPERFLDFL